MSANLATLEIGEKTLKACDARISGGKVEVISIGSFEDAPPFFELDTQKILDEEVSAIRKLFEGLKISKKNLNIVVPDALTYSQIVEMPRLNEKELLSAIKYQADQFIPMPIDQTSLDIEILSENKNSNTLRVLIVAAPQAFISRIENLIEASGFFPESVENELSATSRLITQFFLPPDADGATIFVNVGYTTSSFYLFHHQQRLILDMHNFKIGYLLFLKELQVDMSFDMKKSVEALKNIGFASNDSLNLIQILDPTVSAFSEELKKYIASVKTKFNLKKINSIYLFNYAKDLLYFPKNIADKTSVPCSLLDISAFVKKTAVVGPFMKDLPSYTSALGGCLT